MAYDLNVHGADFAHGKYGHVGIHRFLVTNQVKSVDMDFDVDMADATTLGNSAQANSPGIPKGNIKIEAVSSPTLDFQLAPYKSRQSTINSFIAQRGLSAGQQIVMFPGHFGKDGNKFDEKSIGTNSLEVATSGDFHKGRILLSPKGALLTGASGTGPVDDNTSYGGASTFGGALYVWVWDIQGGTSPTFTVSVQHCTTSGGTYTPLATTTAFNMTAGYPSDPQLVYVPSSTTVNAFTQISWTSTGSPTGVQAVAGFARSYDSSL